MLDLNEDPNADRLPTCFLLDRIECGHPIRTTILSREGKPKCGHVVMTWHDAFCHDCERRLKADDFGPATWMVLSRMRRDYFTTRCPDCHDEFLRKRESMAELDLPDEVDGPGREVFHG